MARTGPPPRLAVGLELARALGGLALLPLRIADFALCNHQLRREFLSLQQDAEVEAIEPRPPVLGRPIKVFLSCAEVSGELHALHFAEALEARAAELGAGPVEFMGLGGERLEEAGVRLVGKPVGRAAMGISQTSREISYYLGLLENAARVFREDRPDVCVLIDSPALHVPLARIAKRYGLPVVHFVSPQLWAWGPWRTAGYRKVMDRTLTILPFEPDWFGRHGVRTAHVGHPLLDALEDVPSTRPPEGSRVLAVLPGSRTHVIERNLPWMLRIAEHMRRELPDLEVVIVQQEQRFENDFRRHVAQAGAEAWATVELGDLHGSLARAGAAFTVSGTILLDLLHHRLPTVVAYRVGNRRDVGLYEHVLSTPWFSSVNLIAGREVLPEFAFTGDGPTERVRAALTRCFDDPVWIRKCQAGLELAARRLGPPGACRRAADQVLDVVGSAPGAPEGPP